MAFLRHYRRDSRERNNIFRKKCAVFSELLQRENFTCDPSIHEFNLLYFEIWDGTKMKICENKKDVAAQKAKMLPCVKVIK